MKKYLGQVIGITLCLAIAVVSYLWATNLMGSMYSYRSPLSNNPPAPGPEIGIPVTSKVVIILVDALRVDTASDPKVMPFLNSMRTTSAWATMHSQAPSYSEAGWTTLLTGAWPDISDGPLLNLDYLNIFPFTQDNLFSAAQRNGLKTAISGYYWFEKMVPQSSVNQSYYTKGEDSSADRQVVDKSIPWLNDDKIGLILIHIDQVDYAGHYEGGPISHYWSDAALRSDILIEQIIGKLDLNKDTVLIISDHGQIDSGGHGGTESIVLTEPFLLMGKGIKPGRYSDVQMVDVAPTVAVLLGTNIPATNQGHPLLNMLIVNVDHVSVINSLLKNQQAGLLDAYSKAIGQNINLNAGQDIVTEAQNALQKMRYTRILRERLIRGSLTLVSLGLFLFLLFKYQPRKVFLISLLLGVIFTLLFNFRYAIMDKHPYSLSWVPGQSELISYCALTTILAFFACWLTFFIKFRLHTKNPSDAFCYTIFLTLSSIFIVAIPIFISFVMNGILVSWTLPDLKTMFVSFLALIQSMLISIIGLMLAGVSALLCGIVRHKSGVM
jgi:hypothetical protein